ncbi:Asp23/Gls24 family envelope stress response protein [Aliibacillus thermotolerans]|uniref:Asp23/Gls24 family envelope stress response protein n=1 Tax=Aliibacillus thermotolerans TaxID=1834418 RepID=A0ABW0U5K8_9BACI|nr:Asp23/Gls24 family envelope stress response protein [Aliibacillus thermotolerans]MDA3130656.1 Asp23/Gls24 family envelope stress response protein [Aliibacillus thermotolerans]
MGIEMSSEYGSIDVSKEVVATIAGGAAIDCYGIVGMASQKQIKDGLSEILGKDNFSRGVVIREEDSNIHIDMYIIVSYGTKISEVAYNVQNKVKYQLQQMLGITVDSVNVYVQGVRVSQS